MKKENKTLRMGDGCIQVGTAVLEDGYGVDHLIMSDRFTGHTFVTGGTGTGKTNAICTMLEDVRKNDWPFLVIDAEYGEYKKMLAEWDDVYNFNVMPGQPSSLKINPLSFPIGLHIRDHIDRVMDVFNVCLELPLGMSVILKGAVERAYETYGWDIETSDWKRTNYGNASTFPDFDAVLNQFRQMLDMDFNPDNIKEQYVRPLYQKIRLLTGAVSGRIFASEETPVSELYEANVVIDISRVPSTELKGLITGFLLMKMEEEKWAYHNQTDGSLDHVTVIEEAQYLLKNPEQEHNTVSDEMMNSSLERIVSAIIEMGDYGEGFIISNSDPSKLNQGVIWNSAQKIMFRVVGREERELLQSNSNLRDEQLKELFKLKKGEALVEDGPYYTPQLCTFKRFNVQKDI